MKVYLAGAIHHVSPTFATGWRREATERLSKLGFEVFDPTVDKNFDHPGVNTTLYTPKQIVETDKTMIDMVDILLVEMSRSDVPYIGTSMEILYAWERGKEIIVWGGSESYWVRYHASRIFKALPEALDYIGGGKCMLQQIEAIRDHVRRVRENCYPGGWTADPLHSVENDLTTIVKKFGRGPASAPERE